MRKAVRYLGSNTASVLLICLAPLLMAAGGVVISVAVLVRTLRGRGFRESLHTKVRIGGRSI